MRIQSAISPGSETFIENAKWQRQLAEELGARLAKAKQQKVAEGRLSARQRVAHLIDADSDFLELSTLAGYGLYEDDVPCAGIVAGIGKVHGRPCVIAANDSSVKGGTYYPITVRKHLRAQEIAAKNHLPCIYLVDSGGAFLPMQDEVFPDHDDFGRIFFNQANLSRKGIPQLSSVHGFCTAGGAYIPAMSDQSVIVRGSGKIFLAGPPLVKAATGEEVSAEELGGAIVHTTTSGVSDHLAENDEHAMHILRGIVGTLGEPQRARVKLKEPREPHYDPEELLGIVPKDLKRAFDIREVIARVVDGSELFEFKQNYGKTLVTGFAHIQGMPCGIIANNGVLFSESALKATHFIQQCTQENVPLVFLQNVTGYMVGKRYENGGIAKDGAKMVHAVACAKVPKITVLIGGSHGAGNYGMCGRAYDPNFLFMWPGARISVMGGQQAADVLISVKEQQLAKKGETFLPEDRAKMRATIEAKYDKEASAYYSTARLWDDGVIDPRSTRRVLAQALASTLYHDWPQTDYGIFRM